MSRENKVYKLRQSKTFIDNGVEIEVKVGDTLRVKDCGEKSFWKITDIKEQEGGGYIFELVEVTELFT